MCTYGWSCFPGNEIGIFDLQTSRLSDLAIYYVLLAGTSYSVTRILSQAHVYVIYWHKVSQHNFHHFHLLNVDTKFRDTEYEVRSPQTSHVFL